MLLKILENILLSDNWYILRKYRYQFKKKNGDIEIHTREVYDRGNGAVVLLMNKAKRTVILTRQFRLPTYLNNNKNGLMIEACAGVLDEKDPEKCVIREAREETGYEISSATKIFECYMSPGAVTELIYFYISYYTDDMKKDKGGGLDEEHEDIEVLEIPFEKAYGMIKTGEIKDGKTVMLLQYAKIEIFI